MSDPQTASITDLTWERGRRCLKEIREGIERRNKDRAGIWERWREFGLILIEKKKEFPDHKLFAKAVAAAQADMPPASSAATRSDAMWFSKLDEECFRQLPKTDCPHTSPDHIRKWARKQGYAWACGDESDGRSVASRAAKQVAKAAARASGAVKTDTSAAATRAPQEESATVRPPLVETSTNTPEAEAPAQPTQVVKEAELSNKWVRRGLAPPVSEAPH